MAASKARGGAIERVLRVNPRVTFGVKANLFNQVIFSAQKIVIL